MKKRVASRPVKSDNLDNIVESEEPKVGKFTFFNGDVYDGEYKTIPNRFYLTKHGTGSYITDNFDVYCGGWDEDCFADSDIYVKYNNDAQYRGRIDSNGTMNGSGTYLFPDGSSIEAVWQNNVPFTNIIFREPLGFAWMVENISKDSITFSPGNHFWNGMLLDQSVTHSTESLNKSEHN
ncbi:phosphatidylinositol 4-phosphate 5-kinase 8-like isoform X2 [Ceratina calcarata]|uniref:Phosphatidylinositol 4-phosphate 5-kinase 8-like isoform X2 n=1 Tax=Ceratina calcarata TaxID=156304 RepID=A0AAJ7IZP9_9HYME|nr:phosphatidylinositol 4-phosphate 5-kinase 8-like isoform X2 [Ceratina calcarata]